MPMTAKSIQSFPRVTIDASLLSVPTIAHLELQVAVIAFYCLLFILIDRLNINY